MGKNTNEHAVISYEPRGIDEVMHCIKRRGWNGFQVTEIGDRYMCVPLDKDDAPITGQGVTGSNADEAVRQLKIRMKRQQVSAPPK